MKDFFKQFFVLTKGGIGIFVLLGGVMGYGLAFDPGDVFSLKHFSLFFVGLYFLSAGSFVLNQTQERHIDKKMNRTKTRPIPSGWISSKESYPLGFLFIIIGLVALYLTSEMAFITGLMTVIFYNVFYTEFWKKRWAFGAVPGAIPGALPVVIGYGAMRENIFTAQCFYLFMILFLWQMPHFWAIAIKLKDDYEKGEIPVLPLKVGLSRTLFHIGLYTFCYVGLAIASPWFVIVSWAYLLVVLPFALFVLWRFVKYFKSDGESGWLPFFLSVNFSVIGFLVAPVFDKWSGFYL